MEKEAFQMLPLEEETKLWVIRITLVEKVFYVLVCTSAVEITWCTCSECVTMLSIAIKLLHKYSENMLYIDRFYSSFISRMSKQRIPFSVSSSSSSLTNKSRIMFDKSEELYVTNCRKIEQPGTGVDVFTASAWTTGL